MIADRGTPAAAAVSVTAVVSRDTLVSVSHEPGNPSRAYLQIGSLDSFIALDLDLDGARQILQAVLDIEQRLSDAHAREQAADRG